MSIPMNLSSLSFSSTLGDFLTLIDEISMIFSNLVWENATTALIMYLFVLTSRKKTLVASFRQGRSTTTSFAHRNAPFPMKGKMIDRVVQFWLPFALRAQVPYARTLWWSSKHHTFKRFIKRKKTLITSWYKRLFFDHRSLEQEKLFGFFFKCLSLWISQVWAFQVH